MCLREGISERNFTNTGGFFVSVPSPMITGRTFHRDEQVQHPVKVGGTTEKLARMKEGEQWEDLGGRE